MKKSNKEIEYTLEENIKALQICGFKVEKFSKSSFEVSKWYEEEFCEAFIEKYFNAEEVICRFAQIMMQNGAEKYKQDLMDKM